MRTLSQKQGRARQRQRIALLLLFMTKPFLVDASYLCDFLIEDTWESLTGLISTSYDGGFVMLCPFSIKGDGCPAAGEIGYVVPSWRNLYIMCEPYYAAAPLELYQKSAGVTGCSIDCPGTHFDIREHGSLTLDSITLRGSNSTSIKIQSNGSLTVFNSYFERNKNDLSNGGAIFAAEGSNVYLSQTSFVNNSARSGGAVYSLGNSQIHNSHFLGNVAASHEVDMGGGALYMGQSSTAYITNSYFADNAAVSFGPAILDRTNGGNYSAQTNTGCNNIAQSFGMPCNGALQVFEGVDVCSPFENVCEIIEELSVATPEPPIQAPTTSFGSTPLAASLIVVPPNAPSVQPTAQVSLSPTLVPTTPPSEAPTLAPSLSPSTSETTTPNTEAPSRSPSGPPPVKPVIASDLASSLTESLASEVPTIDPSIAPISLPPTAALSSNPLAASLALVPSVEPTPMPTPLQTTSLITPSRTTPTSTPSRPPTVEPTFYPTSTTPRPTLAAPPIQVSGAPTAESSSDLTLETPPPTIEGSLSSSESDSSTPLWSYDKTFAPTEQPWNVPNTQNDMSNVQEIAGTSAPFDPTTVVLEAIEFPPSDGEVPIDQPNEFSDACTLFEFDELSPKGSYLQGSLDNAIFDMPELSSCELPIGMANQGKFYRVVGSGAVITAHTCSPFFESFSSDTQLTIYTSDVLGNNLCTQDLNCVTANDDFCGHHSLVNWFAEEGRTYFIYVQGKPPDFASTAGLQQVFSLTVAPTPGGSCAAALPIEPNPLTGEVELPIGGDPTRMDQMNLTGFVWFAIAETGFSWLIASACQEDDTFPAHMKVFGGSCEAGGIQLQQVETIEVRCLSGQILTWLAEPGERYYIKAYNM